MLRITLPKDMQTFILKNRNLFHTIETLKIIIDFYLSGFLSYT